MIYHCIFVNHQNLTSKQCEFDLFETPNDSTFILEANAPRAPKNALFPIPQFSVPF